MGYLDNSTIVVDAVLTKHGRKMLASGGGLNITYFTLSDTGVDYTLWNPDHPSGSAYYGEAIENLPNLEALPNASYFMRNNLITLGRDVVQLPYVALDGMGIGESVSYAFIKNGVQSYSFTIALMNSAETNGWQCIIPDKSLFTTIVGGGWTESNVGGVAQQYLNEQEIQNAVILDGTAGETPATGRLSPTFTRANTSSDRTTTITIISKSTGAYKHFNFTIKDNSGVS